MASLTKKNVAAGYPHLFYIGGALNPAEENLSPTLLQKLEQVGSHLGQQIDIFSGSGGPNIRGAGFVGDPHDRGIGADAVIHGIPIGSYPGAVSALHSAGLRSGATDFLYQGKPDPAHVDTLLATNTTQAKTSANYNQTWPNWIGDVEDQLGLPHTKFNEIFFTIWHNAELSKATNNPLNTTNPAFPNSGAINSQGVRNYTSPEAGAKATAATIQAGYPNIVKALKSGNPFQSKYSNGLAVDFAYWVKGKKLSPAAAYASLTGAYKFIVDQAKQAGNPNVPTGIAVPAQGVNWIENKLSGTAKDIMYGLIIGGGGLIMLVGLVLIAAGLGAGFGKTPIARVGRRISPTSSSGINEDDELLAAYQKGEKEGRIRSARQQGYAQGKSRGPSGQEMRSRRIRAAAEKEYGSKDIPF